VTVSVGTKGRWARWRAEHQGFIDETSRGFYRFRRSRLSIVGVAIIVFLLLLAFTGRYWVPYPDDAGFTTHVEKRLTGPTRENPFGTDEYGRDIFTRTIWATQTTLIAGTVIVLVGGLIGVMLGGIAGYFGGVINEVIMRVTDIMLTMPGIFLALAITAALGPSILHAMAALSITWWPGYCRLVQAQVLSIREEDYVEAARCVGASRPRIIFSHILPNCLSAIMVKASMDFGLAVLNLASLGFIGVGAQPPVPEWGAMISKGREFLPYGWWYSTFPGIAMFLTVFGFNMLGDGIRDLLDPRARR
jgi:peptide/nickel transport system permease protein